MSESYTHKYIYKTAREDNLFLEEYYSGTDTKVFFDDERQTQISYINYSLDEQLKPVYGYASRTFDDLVVGARIVTGTLKVPIQNIEEQSTDEEVMSKTTLEEIEEANNIQNDNIKNTPWTNNPTKEPEKQQPHVPDDLVSSLKDEGYNVDTNSSEDEKTKAVNDYKEKNNIRSNASNDEVLDNLLKNQLKANANVNSTNILMAPGGNDIKYTIDIGENMEVEVLSGPYDSLSNNGKQYNYIKYKDKNGKINTGFVDTNVIEELNNG